MQQNGLYRSENGPTREMSIDSERLQHSLEEKNNLSKRLQHSLEERNNC